MPRITRTNSFPFNIKIVFALFFVSFILFSVLFLFVVPKLQEQKVEENKIKIENLSMLIKEQVELANKAIKVQSTLEKNKTKYKLQVELNEIKKKAFDIDSLLKLVEKSSINKHCSYYIRNSKQIRKNIINANFIKAIKKDKIEQWNTYYFDLNYKTLDRKSKYHSFTSKFDFEDTKFSMFCADYLLNINHAKFEKEIKNKLEKTFSLLEELYKSKTYLLWINPKLRQENTKPLYEENKQKAKQRYSVSNLSKVNKIFTGNLSAKKIIDSANKEPIEHFLDGKEALTWVKDFTLKDDSYIFLLVSTVFVDDLKGDENFTFWKLLPLAIITFILAIIILIYVFKNLFKSINILSQTVKKINQGNRTIRTNIKEDKYISKLGVDFDFMLDSLQEDTQSLDFQVKKISNELNFSLKQNEELHKENELLFKQVHHRVKNNLAFTIGLIELQQKEIKDKKSKKILKDIQERIFIIELLHKKLFESEDLNQIDLKEYVASLVNDIEQRYKMKNKVFVDIQIENIYLDIEKTLPCALILNELITNAFLYAWNDKDEAKLKISMLKEEDEYILKIHDNGKGLDKKIDIYSSSTLGLRLINSIAKLQLKGSLKYKNKKGAFFKVVFK